MSEQNLAQKTYESWDEAFKGLLPVCRQQSVRVAAYSQVLFVQACAASFEINSTEWPNRMQSQYAELAFKCGLYHQLGKSLLLPEQQLWQKVYSEEDKISYWNYPQLGRRLVAYLQENSSKSKEKTDMEEPECSTQNIPWLMIRETCEQHMERWDGSGYPNGRVGNEISPIAQIVGLAKELDRLASETKSENPFDEAYVQLLKMSGSKFSPELIEILKAAKGKCRGVYKKYLQYTQTVSKTVSLVEKRKERPLGLKYRPITEGTKVIAYEAVPWFGGVVEDEHATDTLETLEPMLIHTKTLQDVMFYLLYEATDTILRIQHWRFRTEGILMPLPAQIYADENLQARMDQLFLDQPIDTGKLLMLVPEQVVLKADIPTKERLTHYIENGYQLVLDNYHPQRLTIEKLQDIGFSRVRLDRNLEESPEGNVTRRLLAECGISVVNYGDSGQEVEEETLIQNMLMSEKNDV